jgi:hypothetical protein
VATLLYFEIKCGMGDTAGDGLRGLAHIVNNGKKARFWKDVWLGICPLKIQFSNLFAISNQQGCSVAEALGSGEINLTFKRNFQEIDVMEWEELTTLLSVVALLEEPDSARWALEKDGNFSTSSLYRELTFPGVINTWMMDIWGPNSH